MTQQTPPNANSAVVAPGDLGFVHTFLNTWAMLGKRERFDSPERIKSWLQQRSLIDETETISRKEFDQIVRFRRILRDMLSSESTLSHEQFAELTALAKLSKLSMEF